MSQRGTKSDEWIATQKLDLQPVLPPLHTAKLVRAKYTEIEAKRELRLISDQFRRIVDEHVTQCDCGFNEEEGTMVSSMVIFSHDFIPN